MKSSELIQQLQKQIERHGDCDVMADFERFGSLEEVEKVAPVTLLGETVFEISAG